MIIPHERLAPDTLQSLLESFISREGTDYGESEQSLQIKVERLKTQIVKKEIFIVFDQETESFNILSRNELPPTSMKSDQ